MNQRLNCKFFTRGTFFFRISFALLFIFITVTLNAQERVGIALSNYGGINSVRLNPSQLVNSKLFYDVNFLSADIFLQNNFIFIHRADFRLREMLSKNPVFPTNEVKGEGVDYDASVDFINVFEQTDFYGPSFSIVLGKHAFGLFTRAVTMTQVNRFPGYLGTLIYEGFDEESLHGIPQHHQEFDFASVAWGEIGLSYATTFYKFRYNQWSVGGNIRRLIGYSGAHLKSYDADYTVINQDHIDIRNLDARIGYSLPLDYNTNDFPDPGKFFKGRGLAADVGVTFRRNRELPDTRRAKNYCAEEFEDYIYKIGFSLLDLGAITFKDNAAEHFFNNVSADWDQLDTLQYSNINQLSHELSTVLYGDSLASFSGDRIKIGMPAALSLQADYNYFPNWYVSTVVVVPLQTSSFQLRRPGQAIVNLRYETPHFEMSLPVSLYDFKKLHVGLAARFYMVTIGTDNLGAFFGAGDFYGLDLYFAVKFHITKGWCGRYKPRSDCRYLDF